jgi:hypothetical protein
LPNPATPLYSPQVSGPVARLVRVYNPGYAILHGNSNTKDGIYWPLSTQLPTFCSTMILDPAEKVLFSGQHGEIPGQQNFSYNHKTRILNP